MYNNIKIAAATFFATCFALTFNGVVHAQETDNAVRPLTQAGSTAFLFSIQGLAPFGIGGPSLIDISDGVGGKYYLSDDLALRVLLAFGSSSSVAAPVGPDSAKTYSTSSFGIGAGIEKHFAPLYRVSPYVGAQVGFTSHSVESPEEESTNTVTDKTTAFGAQAFAGFDWYFTRGIAVGAEMALGFQTNGGTKPNGASKTSTSAIGLFTDSEVHLVVHI